MSFTDLADETLLQVTRQLTTHDLLQLRLVCRHVVPSCNSVLAERCKTLHIYPSPTSLKHVLAICDHPVFSKHIEEVILLGKPMWSEIDKAYLGYRNGQGESSEAFPVSRRERDNLWVTRRYGARSLPPRVPRVEWESRFRAWPFFFWSAEDHLKHYEEHLDLGMDFLEASEIHDKLAMKVISAQGRALPFDKTYSGLVGALAKLPKLHRLSFSWGVHQNHVGRSLNQTKQADIWGPAEEHAASYLEVGCGFRPSWIPRQSDADVFYGLLTSRRLHFNSASMLSDLPFTEGIPLRSTSDAMLSRPISFEKMNTLISLTLTFSSGQPCMCPEMPRYNVYRTMLTQSQATLQSLRFTLVPYPSLNPDGPTALLDEAVGPLLADLELTKLERLEFGLLPGTAEQARSTKITQTQTELHRRSGGQIIDLVALMWSFVKTLQHPSITNIVFQDK